MKKMIGFFCFILLGLCLVSCMEEKPNQGNGDTPNIDKLPDDGAYDGEKKIVFWHTMNKDLQNVLQDAIDEFEKANAGWEIEAVQMGVMDQILEETMKSSSKPDLVYAYPEHVARYKEKNMIVNMNPYISDSKVGFSQEKQKDFIKAFYEEGKSFGDGGMYSLPFSKASEVLYYYKNEVKDYPKTWEELEDMGDSNSVTLRVESEIWLFQTLAHQSGADFTSLDDNHYIFDNPTNRKNVEMLKRLYNQHKLVTSQTDKASKWPLYQLASSGAIYWYINSLDELKVAPIPTFEGKKRKAPFQGPSLCMLKQHSVKQMKTWEFIKDYLLDTEFQAKFSMHSLFSPVVKSAYDVKDFTDWLKENSAISSMMNICKSYADDYYFNSPFVGIDKASEEAGNIVINVLNGTKTIDEAFKDAIKNCNS
ncbi:MAG: extracellular solute-binding protein [Anaeroplasmataceae bacterium]|nr:extracellular solute-binding protein [Anaeroplasmataceae bacterium]